MSEHATPVCPDCGTQLIQWRPTVVTAFNKVLRGGEMTYCPRCNVERKRERAGEAKKGGER